MNLDLNRCPTCRQKRIEVAPGVWTWPESTYKLNGKKYNCDCEWQDNLRRHYLLAGIPTTYWSLSDRDYFGDPVALVEVNDYLAQWDNYKSHGTGLEFYSPTQGTGKTMLATLVAKTLIQEREKVSFVFFRDAIRAYSLPEEKRDRFVNRIRTIPVLVLDEVGIAFTNAQHEFFAAELEDIIRFRTSGNSVTIITTNMTPEQLDHEYPRTFSLLEEKSHRIEVKGHDRRRSGEVAARNLEMELNGEVRPIV